MHLKIGFLMNPYAGIGGPAGYKGSDLSELQNAAAKGALALCAPGRAQTFWQLLKPHLDDLTVMAAPAQMGGHYLCQWNIAHTTITQTIPSQTTAEHTFEAAAALVACGIDLLLFVGGDGTARDVYSAVGSQALVLGIPSGVKMHSGVYAINPQCAAQLVIRMLAGDLIVESQQEVRDIDEDSFRKGRVCAKHFGEMRVPAAAEFVQAVKQGGIESEALVLLDIADHLRETFADDALIIWAPGSTTFGLLAEWGHEGTLLGVDVLCPRKGLIKDVDAIQLTQLLAKHAGPVELVLTAIGGQGHIIGRGNQQLTPAILHKIGRDHVHVVATKTKLQTFDGRPLLMDSGDAQLDASWCGLIRVITGYRDSVIYPVGQL